MQPLRKKMCHDREGDDREAAMMQAALILPACPSVHARVCMLLRQSKLDRLGMYMAQILAAAQGASRCPC
jgi:hypothetical protein